MKPDEFLKKKCSRCYFTNEWCLCFKYPKLDNFTKIVIIMNASEFFRLSNSGKLLANTLKNCELRIRGLKDNPLQIENFDKEYSNSTNYVLFPCANSIEISEVEFPKNKAMTLFIPDGNWNQGAKIAKKLNKNQNIIPIKLPQDSQSIYQLRSNPNKHKVSTFEAAINALNYIEKSTLKTNNAMSLFKKMVSQVLMLRGKKSGAKRGT